MLILTQYHANQQNTGASSWLFVLSKTDCSIAVFLAAWSLQIEKKPKLALHRGVFADIFDISLFSLLFRRVFN